VELVEVRSIIEPFNAYRAAINATDEELETIGNILEQLTSEITNEHINVQLEVDFHLEIAKASHNRIFANTISAILPGMIRMLNELDLGLDGRYISSNEEHKQIYDALVKRNPHAAERAMSNH
ncbi:MAG: FCD domain-containing protein, partial [Planctomycetes bacterium]|nr:FCD domain-containing protein [Planctomycetota bacterium]